MNNITERVLQTNIYLQPLQFLLSITINTLNIRILSSRTLRSSLCTYYFLAYAILSIIYTCLLCPIQFARGFSIHWAHGKLACKLHAYVLFVIPLEANLMLVLASFDRYCSSSQICHFQSTRTTMRIARKNILLSTLFCLVYMSPMLFFYYWDATMKKCLTKSHLIIDIYVSSQLIIYYILSPFVMILFGIFTIHKVHQQSNRSIPVLAMIRRRRTECQLARMLFLQVTIHLILVLPFGILYSINSFIPSTRTPKIIAIRLAFVTWQQCDYFVSFFLYVLSANIYRQELRRVFKSSRCLQTNRRHRELRVMTERNVAFNV